MKTLGNAFIVTVLAAALATVVVASASGASSDWNYVAKPPFVQGPEIAASASSLPSALSQPLATLLSQFP